MAATGTCINSTSDVLLVYGDTLVVLPDKDNALYRLPAGRKTPPGWDCDGIYVPNDRIGIQAVGPDKPGPVAVKYGLKIADITFTITQSGNKYNLYPNQGVFTPSETCKPSRYPICVNWEIPNISHTQISRFPEVPGHLPV